MNQTYTLKELADIGGLESAKHSNHQKAREAFTKAVLDAIGYEFPKDEEREAFDAWYQSAHIPQGETQAFAAWKAGRKELRRSLEVRDARTEQEHAAELAEPAWIPWDGGECPLADGVKRWEYRMRNGNTNIKTNLDKIPEYWSHAGLPGDIVAYRVLEG